MIRLSLLIKISIQLLHDYYSLKLLPWMNLYNQHHQQLKFFHHIFLKDYEVFYLFG